MTSILDPHKPHCHASAHNQAIEKAQDWLGVQGGFSMGRPRSLVTSMAFAAGVIVISALSAIPVQSQSGKLLHPFKGSDGISPALSVVFDSAGNLYGVAAQGGASNNGTVFELVKAANGSFTEKTLLSFNGGSGGSTPVGGLIFDNSGNLYGTTKLGGAHGVGVTFELVHSSASWTEKVLHSFGAANDGQYPTASLALDNNGNLFGTTEAGGVFGKNTESSGGTAFKLSQAPNGTWTETVIHSFGNAKDGAIPRANLIFDATGNLYGTTQFGGAFSGGTVFKLAPQVGSAWKESILHNFIPNSSDETEGYQPIAGLIFDQAGNLYGTTLLGGDFNGGGSVFELSPTGGGAWKRTTLYGFNLLQPEEAPYSGVLFDSSGNLYGAVIGKPNGGQPGTIYKLTPQSGTQWIETDVYSFNGTNGASPGVGSLIMDSSGNLYGATQFGGPNHDGVVFKVTP